MGWYIFPSHAYQFKFYEIVSSNNFLLIKGFFSRHIPRSYIYVYRQLIRLHNIKPGWFVFLYWFFYILKRIFLSSNLDLMLVWMWVWVWVWASDRSVSDRYIIMILPVLKSILASRHGGETNAAINRSGCIYPNVFHLASLLFNVYSEVHLVFKENNSCFHQDFFA